MRIVEYIGVCNVNICTGCFNCEGNNKSECIVCERYDISTDNVEFATLDDVVYFFTCNALNSCLNTECIPLLLCVFGNFLFVAAFFVVDKGYAALLCNLCAVVGENIACLCSEVVLCAGVLNACGNKTCSRLCTVASDLSNFVSV